MVALLHLHGVAQSAGGAGHNGDLLHRGGMALQGRHQGMADFMIGHQLLLLVGEDGVLLLVAGNDHLNALLQVGLGGKLPAIPDRPQGSLVDDVGQLRAGGAGGHPGHLVEVHIVGNSDLFGVDLQNGFPALQVRQLHRHPAVKAAGAGQGRVKAFGPVGGRQDHDAAVALKAVHLRQQLVQGLLPLVVAAHGAAVALLADGVDLVDEHDAGGLLLGLLEQVPDLGGTHAHEHLHKLRAGDGEEGHVRLTGHGLGQHGLAGARRANQQHALGHLGADLPVLGRVVEVVHNLLQALLRLVHALHIRELDAVRGFHINPGLAAAHVEHHGLGAAGLVHHLAGQELPQSHKENDGQQPAQQHRQNGRGFLHDLAGELRPGGVKPLRQPRVVHLAGLVYGFFVLISEDDLVILHLHQAHFALLGHADKGAVIHLLDFPAVENGHEDGVEEHQHQHHHKIVKQQRTPGLLDLVHSAFAPFPFTFLRIRAKRTRLITGIRNLNMQLFFFSFMNISPSYVNFSRYSLMLQRKNKQKINKTAPDELFTISLQSAFLLPSIFF